MPDDPLRVPLRAAGLGRLQRHAQAQGGDARAAARLRRLHAAQRGRPPQDPTLTLTTNPNPDPPQHPTLTLTLTGGGGEGGGGEGGGGEGGEP
eukprot:scaffold31953_cov43-Phaeocystis_antarctica.AAC.3